MPFRHQPKGPPMSKTDALPPAIPAAEGSPPPAVAGAGSPGPESSAGAQSGMAAGPARTEAGNTTGAQSAVSPLLSIIVVSYNTLEMTTACIHSVIAQTKTPYELIVVDNNSPDGSGPALEAAFPPADYPMIRIYAETANHGFAKANNLAAHEARGEYLLLLNPDTVVLDGAIDKLFAFSRARPEALIWGGRTLFGDGRLNASSCWHRLTLWNVFCRATGWSGLFPKSEFWNSEAYGGWQRDTERAVDVVVGAFLLIPKALWQRLGGFDLQFVMYGEEADLCLRAREYGADPRVTPGAEIIHYVGASEKVQVNKAVVLLKAKILLIQRHFPAWQRGMGVWLMRSWPGSRAVGFRILSRLTGRKKDSAALWNDVWARREEWWDGWPPLPADTPPPEPLGQSRSTGSPSTPPRPVEKTA